jgi:outer membrane protein
MAGINSTYRRPTNFNSSACAGTEHILDWNPLKNLLPFSPMKLIRNTVLTAILVMAATLSVNAQTKVATVDMKKLFNGYYKTKLAQASLETRKLDLRKDIKEMADGLEKSQGQYKQLMEQSNDPAITAEERDKRKQALAELAKDINGKRGSIEQFQRQSEAQLADQSQRMSGNLVADIQKVVNEKAKAAGYTVVLNSASVETVIYAGPENDLTAPVLTQLNVGAPVDLPLTEPAGVPLNISTNLP